MQVGNLRPIGSRPSPVFADLSPGRLPIGRRLPACITLLAATTLYAASSDPLPPYQLPFGKVPPAAEGVRIDENLGRVMDLSLTFRDEDGREVALNNFFHQGRPVILNLVYYNCPMLCNLILN